MIFKKQQRCESFHVLEIMVMVTLDVGMLISSGHPVFAVGFRSRHDKKSADKVESHEMSLQCAVRIALNDWFEP